MRWFVVLGVGFICLALVRPPFLSGVSVSGQSTDPVFAAVGDIACDHKDQNYNSGNGTPSACRMKASYDWQFLPEAGVTFTDAGTGVSSGAGTLTPTPRPSRTPKPRPTPTSSPTPMQP